MFQSEVCGGRGRDGVLGRVFPGAYATSRWPSLDWVVLVALVVLALTNFIEADIARKAEWIVLLATLLAAPRIRRGDPDAWLYIAFFVAVVFMLAINAWAKTHWAVGYEHNNFTRQHARFFWCVIAGWWLGGTERGVLGILAVALAGLFLAVGVNGSLADWARLLDGGRVDFGIHNAQHTGILFATALLGLLALAPRFLDGGRRGIPRLAMGGLWGLLVVATGLIVLGAQSRQVFLGLLVVGVAWLVAAAIGRRGRVAAGLTPRIRIRAGVIALALVIAPVLVIDADSPLVRKTGLAVESVHMALTRPPEAVERTSTTIRLMQWRAAIEAIQDRPWLGHGAARGRVLEQADIPERFKAGFGHFHNSYLELWVSYGVLGPLMLLSLLGVLAVRLIRAARTGDVRADLVAFGLSFLVFFAVVNVFESYVSTRSGSHLMLFVGGAIYSLTLPGRQRRHWPGTGDAADDAAVDR